MPICYLRADERRNARELLSSCSTGLLERVLSSEDVYLGFQHELLGLDAESRHHRIAELVSLLFGNELLRNNDLRKAICESRGLDCPSTWKPGTVSAVELCESLELPSLFAGSQPPPSLAPIVTLESASSLPPLQDFQREVLEKSRADLWGNRSVLLSLPTGGGKTRVAVELLREWHSDKEAGTSSIWIAHTEELCDQAAECIIDVWRSRPSPAPAALVRAWGRNARRLSKSEIFEAYVLAGGNNPTASHAIIVTTPKSAIALFDQAKRGSFRSALDRLSFVAIDEAHRAAAPTYVSLLSRLRREGMAEAVLGLSATPVRETYSSRPFDGTRELSKLFESLVEPTNTLGTTVSPVVALQQRGVLAKLSVDKIDVRLSNSLEVAKAVARRRRESRTIGPALLFSQTASEAKVFATYLAEEKLKSAYLTADSPESERRTIVRSLREGRLDILCNCEILTTGFDAPAVAEVYLARKTESPVLYKQIVGRGMRGPAFGGAVECKLYLCGFDLPFDADPNTSDFARAVWAESK